VRPELSEELVKKVVEKWRRETGISIDIPKSKIIEDILIKYLERPVENLKVRDRKRDRLFRTFVKMKRRIKFGNRMQASIKINSVEFGSIVINNRRYSHDVIVSYKGLIQEGKLKTRHLISKKEFNLMLVEDPKIIVFGRGFEGCLKISPEVLKLAELKGIRVISLLTPDAIEAFNKLHEKDEKVVAYIHVTC